MGRLRSQKAYLAFILVLCAFVVLPGCGKGVFGGGHWYGPVVVTATIPATTIPGPTPGASVNTEITASFSQDMSLATITAPGTFTVTGPGAVPVLGAAPAVTYDGPSKTATFHPAAALTPGVTYTATITTAAQDLDGTALSSSYVWSFTTGSTPDTTRPVVTSTVPATTIPGPTPGVPTNTAITVAFNKDMSPASVTATGTFTVTGPGAVPVVGAASAVTYDIASKSATFHPAAALNAGVTYTVTIKGLGAGAATDSAGNALAGNPALPLVANDYLWSFTTSLAADTTRPLVTSTVPATSIPGPTLGVPTNTALTVAFNKDMFPASVTATGTFTVTGPGATPVIGAVPAVTYDVASKTATFHPAAALTPGVTYTATVKGAGAGAATDSAGNALAGNPALPLVANDYLWSFTTSLAADTTRPVVTSTIPATTVPGPTPGASTNTAITATFNEDMNPATITAPGAFTLTGPGSATVVAAVPAVTYDVASKTATFHPAAALTPGVTYSAIIKGVGSAAVTDSAGNALAGNPALPLVANDYLWSFATGAAAAHLGPNAVSLGRAGTFRVLAGSALTNTDVVGNRTSVNGDAGVSPGSTVNGFTELLNIVPPFHLYAGVPTAANAKIDLLAAYTDAQSRSTAAISLPGQIGGLTLAPGLYVNSTSSGISGTGPNAILTLDGQGDPTAVWIFKMGSTLITDPGTSIVCNNGCNPENIFWQVGSSATVGVGSIFYGTILADASITMNTGSTLHGRALTRSGAVTLDTSKLVP